VYEIRVRARIFLIQAAGHEQLDYNGRRVTKPRDYSQCE